MSIKLQPIDRNTKKKVKVLQEKQNNWVLDCVNEQKTKLQPYSVVKDRFLKYFVVRVPKKQRNYSKTQRHKQSPMVDSIQFRDFLTTQKQKLVCNKRQFDRRLTERATNQFHISKIKKKENDNDVLQTNQQNHQPFEIKNNHAKTTSNQNQI